MVGFLATQSETGLFIVSAVFGLGFSGIIPASCAARAWDLAAGFPVHASEHRRFRHFHWSSPASLWVARKRIRVCAPVTGAQARLKERV
jgi:hypothetical protein